MRVLIIGGGVAGISAAIKLLDCASEITILEANKNLGGRISSFQKSNGNFPELDLGQHALSASYSNFISLLKKVNPNFSFSESEKIDVTFRLENKEEYDFPLTSIPRTIDKIRGIFNLGHLTLSEKFQLIRFLLFIKKANPKDYENVDVQFLFSKFNQFNLLEKFWDKILLSIYNTKPNKISASLFINTIKTIFFSSKNSQQIIVTRNSLNQIFVLPAKKYLQQSSNVKILTKEKVIKINAVGNKVTEIITSKSQYKNFDYVITTLQPFQLKSILKKENLFKNVLSQFTYGNIVTAYIKLKENTLSKRAYLLVNSKIDWVFNLGDFVSVVVSNADEFSFNNKKTINEQFLLELNKLFSVFSFENILDFVLINKKKSTTMSDILNYKLRKQIYSPYKNLILAGDWVSTELPSTIESAVVSAIYAGERICFRRIDRTIKNH